MNKEFESALIMEIAPLVGGAHYNALKHIGSGMLLFGWENFSDIDQDLNDWGCLIGSWMGDLKHPARPMWELSEFGKKLLKVLEEKFSNETFN